MKMDMSKWKEFRVGDLFSDVITGKIEDYKVFSDGGVPILSSTMFNQGIACFADCDAMFFNRLTVAYRGAGAGYVSYHSGGFNATLNCGVMINNFELTENIGLFLASLLTSRLIEKYDYKNIITPSRMLDEIIKLPVTSSGDPDWNYMEQYMHSVMENCEKKYQTLVRISQEKHRVDTTAWGEFRVGDLFICDTTLSIPSKNDLNDGNLPYITRSAVNNGFSGTCGNADHLNKGQCITIGAEGFVAFWQHDDFVAGNKVYTIRHKKMNEMSGLFICAALNTLSSRYSFAEARILDKIKDEVILLPIVYEDVPDWDYMEQYMKRIMQRQSGVVDALKKIA